MNLKEAITIEFEFRVFEESYPRIYRCLSMIDDSMVWKQPNECTPSIGNLVLHLCGNARQWVLSGLGDKVDNRDRDQEFVSQQNIKKSELIFLLENLKSNLKNTINSLSEEDIQQIYVIQGFSVSGFSILAHVMEHFSYHTGQITTLTKIATGKQTGYYSEVDLNKRNG
ncbi:MAG: DinB family protein [Bacteroidota bacterium]